MYVDTDRAAYAPGRQRAEPRGYGFQLFVLVFAGYYLGTRIGLALTFLPNPISVLWPPNAILFAALLVVPHRLWWAVIAAALPAHLLAELQGGVPIAMVLCWFVSNMTEALIGAACVRLLVREPLTFEALRDVSAFLFAAFVATFASSFLDSGFVALNHWGRSAYWDTWRVRLLSNFTASLTFVPLIVTFRRLNLAQLGAVKRSQSVEAAALLVGLLGVTLAVFDSGIAASVAPALIYLPLPFLLWAALRFGPAGASAAFATVAICVIWGTGHGLGPLGMRLPAENALSVQLFLIFVGPALLCLAAALAERARAQRSLLLSDRRFQLVLQATKDSVYERDVATDALWWSGNGLAQFGYAADNAPGNFASTVEMLHPDDRERTIRTRAGAVDNGDPLWEAEFRLRRPDGTYAHVHEQGLIVRDAGRRPLQMIATLTDVTERHDADEFSQRLAQASRLTAIGELTASIAHEINQPMSAILSNVDAAEMLLDAGDQGSSELRRVLDDIRSDDLRASEIIQHIRGLAKKRKTEVEQFDINDLIRAVLRLVGPTVKQRGVALDTDLKRVPLVRADRIHVQQVLLNLLFNGMDAMSTTPDGERALHITTSQIDMMTVEVRVRDRGHGVPPDQLDRIFDSFFTTKKNGMGLGLSITRSLLQTHGGAIRAENNGDAGATFRFTLPTVERCGDAPPDTPRRSG